MSDGHSRKAHWTKRQACYAAAPQQPITARNTTFTQQLQLVLLSACPSSSHPPERESASGPSRLQRAPPGGAPAPAAPALVPLTLLGTAGPCPTAAAHAPVEPRAPWKPPPPAPLWWRPRSARYRGTAAPAAASTRQPRRPRPTAMPAGGAAQGLAPAWEMGVARLGVKMSRRSSSQESRAHRITNRPPCILTTLNLAGQQGLGDPRLLLYFIQNRLAEIATDQSCPHLAGERGLGDPQAFVMPH